MKFKPTTLALIAIAILLGGVVYFTETRNSSSPETTEEAGGSIFEFEESQVQSFTVETPAQTLSFENEAGQWQVQQPESAPASDASVAYLLNLLATGESDRTLTVPTADLAEFGLDQPSATINVVLDSEETHQLILGGANFDNSAIYAQADPEANSEPSADEAETTVLLVSPDFVNAVNRPLEECDRSQKVNPPPLSHPTRSEEVFEELFQICIPAKRTLLDLLLYEKSRIPSFAMSKIPDRISTLELSKLYIYKALKEIEAQREQDQKTEKKD
ncbi:MAG: DUF4340 domain-containing protein [Leptolyngbyaceae cyanobacterium RM1_405_57]|nr:DUF4340 domain-containing protein [Leptolyngbyaceae cyanobacterium RM1_405_57]